MLKSLAHCEAVIDFGDDEDDIDDDVFKLAGERIRNLRDEILIHLKDGNRGEIVRHGVNVTLLGKPNAGKSSFLNLLARRDVAIVSPIPGTTRDIVEVQLNLAGYPVTISDTAGLRETTCDIEAQGMKKVCMS